MQWAIYEKKPWRSSGLLRWISKKNQSWEFSYSIDRVKQEPNTSVHGTYTIWEQDNLQTKYGQLAMKLESLELKKIHEVSTSSSNEEICDICDRQGNSTAGCLTLLKFKEV